MLFWLKARAKPQGVGVRFATADGVETLPLADSNLLELPNFAQEIEDFQRGVEEEVGALESPRLVSELEFLAPTGNEIVAVNVFGRLAYMAVNTGLAPKLAGAFGLGPKGECDCTSGEAA